MLHQFHMDRKAKELDFTLPSRIFHSLIHHRPKYHIWQLQDSIFFNIVLLLFSGNSFPSFVLTPFKHLCCSVFTTFSGKEFSKDRICECLLVHVFQNCIPLKEQTSKPRRVGGLEARWASLPSRLP